MTDRELLEKAAKAAGWASWDCLGGDDFLNVYDADGRHDTFAPLTDDGDALRLAVKLHIDINHGVQIVAAEHVGKDIGCAEGYTKDGGRAATRRAIVRAAAAIGEAL
jgi:hypothetical protein